METFDKLIPLLNAEEKGKLYSLLEYMKEEAISANKVAKLEEFPENLLDDKQVLLEDLMHRVAVS